MIMREFHDRLIEQGQQPIVVETVCVLRFAQPRPLSAADAGLLFLMASEDFPGLQAEETKLNWNALEVYRKPALGYLQTHSHFVGCISV